MNLLYTLGGKRGAELSDCGTYRYRLRRILGEGTIEEAPKDPITFVMLNPSTATAAKDDPTIRRCTDYATRWGYSELLVANLFAYRAADPQDLVAASRKGVDIVGPENDAALRSIPVDSPIVAAWGAHKLAEDRAKEVVKMLGRELVCLAVTTRGAPRHPLYLPKDLQPFPYWGPNWPENERKGTK